MNARHCLPFQLFFNTLEKYGACGNNDGYHHDEDVDCSESCNDGNEEQH